MRNVKAFSLKELVDNQLVHIAQRREQIAAVEETMVNDHTINQTLASAWMDGRKKGLDIVEEVLKC